MALDGDAEMEDDARNARLEAMSDCEETALEALDDEFYALPTIERALSAYFGARPDQFSLTCQRHSRSAPFMGERHSETIASVAQARGRIPR